jgi:hypothetical protein
MWKGKRVMFIGKNLPNLETRIGSLVNIRNRIRKDLLNLLDLPGNEVKRMRTIIRSQPELFDKYDAFLDVYIMELRKKQTDISYRYSGDLNALLYVRLAEILAMGISRGLFRRVDPLITAQALISMIETLAFEMVGKFNKERAKEKFYKVEQLFVDGLLSVQDS